MPQPTRMRRSAVMHCSSRSRSAAAEDSKCGLARPARLQRRIAASSLATATVRRARQWKPSKPDQVELGQRHLRADARGGREVPGGIELRKHVVGAHAVNRDDDLEPAQRRRAGGMQYRGLRLRPHRHHGLDALVLERLLELAADELVGSKGGSTGSPAAGVSSLRMSLATEPGTATL